ncbi:MAG: DUF6273 domain-containing protein [Treponema sp.]|jgi:hypothetical protein|nr:DUF6273 domain-containing protein [Treponema sp.]
MSKEQAKEKEFNMGEKAVQIVDDILSSFGKSLKRLVSLFNSGDEAIKYIHSEITEAFAEAGLKLTKSTPEAASQCSYTGERRDLVKLLGCFDWADALVAIYEITHYSGQKLPEIKPGDYITMPVRVDAAKIDGLVFKGLDIAKTEAVVIDVNKDGIVFQFDDVLFLNAVNRKDTNEGGFANSTLGKYLNKNFISVFPEKVQGILQYNSRDNLRITLPTLFEVFGDRDDKTMNWSKNPYQFDYFKKRKNRIKTHENDTQWWWLSSPNAAHAASFCYVHYYGHAYNGGGASEVSGGVAPAFCVPLGHE